MTPRDRVLQALNLEEPDVLPMLEIEINKPIVRRLLGREPINPLDYYQAYCLLGLDGINFWDTWIPVKYLNADLFIDDWSRIWRSLRENEVTYYVKGTVTGPEGLDGFVAPDPCDYDRLNRLQTVAQANSRQLAVVGGVHDAWEIPSQMRGVGNLLVDFYKNPGFARRLIGLSVDYNVELAKAMGDLGVDVIVSGDDYAYKHGPMMSPKHFTEFIAPGLRRLVETVHGMGKPFIKHCDGYVWPIMGTLMETCIDALHPIEPMAGMSLREVKEHCGDRLCLIGNVDVSHVLPLGSVEETICEVKRCIVEASCGGGHILSSSNSIHNGVKVENLKAMTDAAKKYGKYPIRGVAEVPN